MQAKSIILLMTIYFAIMALVVASMLPQVHASLSHDKIMDGFVHAQKAPQMGHPVIYLPAKKVLGKHHKKGKPHGEQKFARGRVSPKPTPVASSTPEVSPSGSLVPGGGSSNSGQVIIIIRAGEVDLRARDGSIKDQVGPICTAYGGNAGVENLLGPGAPDFSEEYTFSLYGVYSVDEYANNVPGKFLALNSMWPRGERKPANFFTSSHRLISMAYLGDGEIQKAKDALQKSHPVFFGLEVPADMASCLASIRPTSKVTRGGHAVLIVGYKDDSSNPALGGGYFIIKNSWSEGCGDHGYQYLPYSYCEKSYCYLYEMSSAQ